MHDISGTLKHFFTPHHTNNHRPRILHPEMLIAIIAILFTLNITFRVTASSYPLVLGYATNITTEDLLLYSNQERLDKGLNSLRLNPVLSQAAEKKAQDMFEDNYWAHIAPDGKTPWDFMISEGYAYTYAGENLARDFSDSKGVVQAWMDSPSHRENLLRDSYEEIGFAVVNGTLDGDETTLVVQMFGTPKIRAATISVSAANSNESTTAALAALPTAAPTIAAETLAQINHVPVSRSVIKPVIDQSVLQKNTSLLVLGGLAVVLIIDAVIIWRRRTVRIAGHNFAHIIFIVSLIGIMLISTRGSVLSFHP